MYASTQSGHNSNNNNNNVRKRRSSSRSTRFKLEQRRRQVASLVAQSRTEEEIAQTLGVDQSTVSRDIQAIREESIHFVHDLAKFDLAFQFHQSIRGVDEVKRRLWDLIHSDQSSTKEKLMAFRLIMVAEETRFRLLEKGPIVMGIETAEQKLKRILEANEGHSERNTKENRRA
jgi:DNA-binding CsgD family transcriptional regulator